MRGRSWLIVIGANVVISSLVVFGILVASGRISFGRSSTTDVTPTSSAVPPAAAIASEPANPEPAPEEPAGADVAAPASLVHTVEAGDTLSGISQKYGVELHALISANDIPDPDVLSLGQEIKIPSGRVEVATGTPPVEETAEPEQVVVGTVQPTAPAPAEVGTAPPTPTISGPPLIEIAQVLGSAILGEEVVVIRNRGGAQSLEAWTLTGTQGNTYLFPALTVYGDAEVRLHSKTGTSNPSDLYWGLVEPGWQAGELITLRNDREEVIDTYIVP